MGCTPSKPNNIYPTERFVNSLVYNIHSSVPPVPPDPNETKIIQVNKQTNKQTNK
ncbi:hypothetical protein WDU94_012315 [Cyamophila willieti]